MSLPGWRPGTPCSGVHVAVCPLGSSWGRLALHPALSPLHATVAGAAASLPCFSAHRAALGREDHGGPQVCGAREETR